MPGKKCRSKKIKWGEGKERIAKNWRKTRERQTRMSAARHDDRKCHAQSALSSKRQGKKKKPHAMRERVGDEWFPDEGGAKEKVNKGEGGVVEGVTH